MTENTISSTKTIDNPFQIAKAFECFLFTSGVRSNAAGNPVLEKTPFNAVLKIFSVFEKLKVPKLTSSTSFKLEMRIIRTETDNRTKIMFANLPSASIPKKAPYTEAQIKSTIITKDEEWFAVLEIKSSNTKTVELQVQRRTDKNKTATRYENPPNFL